MVSHEIQATHVHARLVRNPEAREDPYGAAISTIRGALAFGLNHVGQMNDHEAELLSRIHAEMLIMDPVSAPSLRTTPMGTRTWS